MKKFTIQIIFLLLIIFVSLAISTSKFTLDLVPQSTQQSKVKIKNVEILVDVADSPSERKAGLSGRDSLASNSGMLFVFQSADRYTFWMKGLKFPLDFVWIKDLRVVDIIRNASPPQPNQPEETLPRYLPNQAVDMVLEVNGGFVDNHDVVVGDNIEIIK